MSFLRQPIEAKDKMDQRFMIVGEGGPGNNSQVLIARDVACDKVYALKIMRDVEAARAEARITRLLSDLGLPYFPLFQTLMPLGEDIAIVMDYLPLTPAAVTSLCFFAEGVFSGLNAAHNAGIAHRDLHPDNVRLDREGYAVLIDWGWGVTKQGCTEIFAGAPDFVSPNVFYPPPNPSHEDMWQVTCKNDVWAATLLVLSLVTRKPLHWQRDSVAENSCLLLFESFKRDPLESVKQMIYQIDASMLPAVDAKACADGHKTIDEYRELLVALVEAGLSFNYLNRAFPWQIVDMFNRFEADLFNRVNA